MSFLIKHMCLADLRGLNGEGVLGGASVKKAAGGGGSYFKERGQGGVLRLPGKMKKEP